MRRANGKGLIVPARSLGFTLIEVLVVVAIIALLVSILLPSLNRARAQARAVNCQSNIRQVMMAFLVYATENRNCLPGHSKDSRADWLGGVNINKRDPALPPLQPEDGTIYKHMGKSAAAYTCPDDFVKRSYPVSGIKGCDYSYTSNSLLSGAPVEFLAGAHYPRSMPFNRNDHRIDMQAFEGAPVLIKEDPYWWLARVDDSSWCNQDTITDRHLRSGSQGGSGNVAYHDGHAGRVRIRVPADPAAGGTMNETNFFVARAMCIRTVSGKWISGRSWESTSGQPANYGYLPKAEPASARGVVH